MEIWTWVSQNWFEFLSSIGIIGGLWFNAVSLHSETKTRRIANLLTLTGNQRELLKVFYQNQPLTRVLDPAADTASLPINRAEEMYVSAMIQHLSSAYRAMQSDLTIKPEGIHRDVREFFTLPIPKFVWEKIKKFQDADFVQFVENCSVKK
jgi:hypothetical protein